MRTKQINIFKDTNLFVDQPILNKYIYTILNTNDLHLEKGCFVSERGLLESWRLVCI